MAKHIRKKCGEKVRKNRFYAVAWILFLLEAAGFAAVAMYFINLAVLPYDLLRRIIFIGIIVLAVQLLLLLITAKRRPSGVSKLNIAISVVLIVALLVSGGGVALLYGRMGGIEQDDSNYTLLTVYTRADSGLDKLLDIDGRLMGVRDIVDTENTALALTDISEKLGSSVETTAFNDFTAQAEALRAGEVDSILLNEAFKGIVTEHIPDFDDWAQSIYTVRLESAGSSVLQAEVTTEPFFIYLSGLDTSGGEITDYGNSDVNMIMVVNPVTKKVLLVNVPRDYYLGLYGDSSKMDKLTHAGAHGVDCSMQTLGAFFGIEFNYYVKVNFRSVVDIVDALGGVTVESDVAFSSNASLSETRYYFTEGANELTGDSALAFARERNSFWDGDRQRGKNQQKVIDAMIDKITSPAVITGFSDLLSAITENVKTSLTIEEINSLIQMQLTDMASWDVEMTSVTGSDAHATTYSGGSLELYVMRPDMDSVAAAIELIEQTVAMPTEGEAEGEAEDETSLEN